MKVSRVEFHMMDGKQLLATDEDAEYFADVAQRGIMEWEWLPFPIDKNGVQQILHLSLVTRIIQWHDMDELEPEDE
jgi:hypothetical protein